MQRRLWAVVGTGLVAVLALGGIARAGTKTSRSVYVSANQRSASGSTGSARNNSGHVEYIGCQTGAAAEAGMIQCYAVNAAGLSASCVAQDSTVGGQQLGSLSLMADGAYIGFDVDDSGHCVDISVIVASDNEPKRP